MLKPQPNKQIRPKFLGAVVAWAQNSNQMSHAARVQVSNHRRAGSVVINEALVFGRARWPVPLSHQRVEDQSAKPCVAGSNPAGGTSVMSQDIPDGPNGSAG